jgi:Uma2 family endonuclease
LIATLRPLTYDDLVEMPDDGQRYEIIDGELIVSPAPIASHQRVLKRLVRVFDDFANETRSGEVFFAPFDIQLGYHDIVEPDLVFIASKQGHVPGQDHKFDGSPHECSQGCALPPPRSSPGWTEFLNHVFVRRR